MDIFCRLPLELQNIVYRFYLSLWISQNYLTLHKEHLRHFQFVLNELNSLESYYEEMSYFGERKLKYLNLVNTKQYYDNKFQRKFGNSYLH